MPQTIIRRPFFWKIILLILSIPAFIAISEIILTIIPINTYFESRFFLVNRSLDYPEIFKKDHDLFWRFRTSMTVTSRFFDGKTYHINSYGLRGDEIPPRTDKIRIVALGNSCTFGWGMADDQTFEKQLGAMISGDPILPKAEVINAGIPGYSSYQAKNFFQSDIVPLQPDIVLIMFAWNDQWAAADNIPDDRQKLPPQTVLDIQNALDRLKIYRLAKKLLLSAIEKPLSQALDRTNPVYRVSFDDFYANLNAIVNYARSHGIKPILMTSPIPALGTYYPPGRVSPMHRYHEAYNEQTRLVAQNNDVPLIDLARIFDNYNNLYDDAQNDPIHFNAAGHRVVAQAIYDYLKSHPELMNRK